MDSANTVVLNSSDDNAFAAIIGVIVGLSVIALVFGIIWYMLQAIGFYRLAKNRNIKPAWIAWIPICQNYLLGELINNKVWGIGNANWVLTAIPAISVLMSSFYSDLPDTVAIIFLFILTVFYIYIMTAMYKLYKMYSTKPVLLLVLSIIFPFLSSIFIFAIRNNKQNLVIK